VADRADVCDADLDDNVPTLLPHQLTGLVRGDTDQPGPKAIGIAKGLELPPGLRPGRLDGVLGEVLIAADDEGDAGHVVVVGADDPGQGIGVPGRGLGHGRGRDRRPETQVTHHALLMPREAGSVPRTLARERHR
jgi:hypothetical protein